MITIQKLNAMLAERDETIKQFLDDVSHLQLTIGNTRMELVETKEKLKYEIAQGKIYRNETERLKSRRLCTKCKCQAYHHQPCDLCE